MTATYTGEEVAELINIVLEEADYSINKAYAEGYKQASLEFLPQVEFYKASFDNLMIQNQQTNIKDKVMLSVTLFSIGVIAGSTLTLIFN